MRPISRIRFDAIAGYAREPLARVYAEELAWFEHGNAAILGLLYRDRLDGDFAGAVFAPDARNRFRHVSGTSFTNRPRMAEVRLRVAMEEAFHASAEAHHQGDEVRPTIDFFATAKPSELLNRDFLNLAGLKGYSAARRIIEYMMRWHEDADGNFAEQFQTTGFDQRIWELYLFAAFTEMGYHVQGRPAVPDFTLRDPFGHGEVLVEAVTVGPSGGGAAGAPPAMDTPEGVLAYIREYMPIRFGGALYSKLRKRYWDRPNVAGKPLVFAIEDFSAAGSMVFSRSAIDVYLYGYDHDPSRDEQGSLVITPRRVGTHRWGEKVINSGFFDLDDAQHVSAVLFSNSGTIAKFNRMGTLAGFGPSDVVLIREGTATNHDPDADTPLYFRHLVNSRTTVRRGWRD